jgi:hypothetical protein
MNLRSSSSRCTTTLPGVGGGVDPGDARTRTSLTINGGRPSPRALATKCGTTPNTIDRTCAVCQRPRPVLIRSITTDGTNAPWIDSKPTACSRQTHGESDGLAGPPDRYSSVVVSEAGVLGPGVRWIGTSRPVQLNTRHQTATPWLPRVGGQVEASAVFLAASQFFSRVAHSSGL